MWFDFGMFIMTIRIATYDVRKLLTVSLKTYYCGTSDVKLNSLFVHVSTYS